MRLGELLDVSVLEKLAGANYLATGMPFGIVDAVDGSVLVGFGWQDVCTMYHRVNPITAERCRESDTFIKDHLDESSPCEYTCKNGLRDIGIPIRVAGEHLATLFLGQFFYEGESPDREYFIRQARDLGFDVAPYLAALARVPVFPRATVENTLRYNAALARIIAELAEGSLRRRQAEASLDRERTLLASIMHATDVMLVYLDRDFNFVWVNAAYAGTCDMRPDELVGKNHFALYPHADNEAIFRRVRDTGEAVFFKDKSFEFPDQPQRGVTYWDWSLVPVKEPSGKVQGLVFSLRETTKFKRAELELDEERMRWRGVVEGIADEVWVCDAKGRMSLINLPGTTAMGLPPFEGKPVEEVLDEVDILYPDGRPRPPEEAPLLRSARKGEVVRGEEIMRHRASGRARFRQFSCAPMRDAAGTITGAVAIVRDITESKRNEEALREADRRKDEFLGMLAHELRNPLAPIRTAIDLLGRVPPGTEQATRAQRVIGRQAEHMARLVDDLLDVSRVTRGQLRLQVVPLDLAEVTRMVADDYRPVFANAGVALALEVSVRRVPVEGDATRLGQVVGNLLSNSAKFTPRGGKAFVSVEAVGDRARLCVRDTGAGIDPAIRERLFQPFTQSDRTLARSSGGLGLGLSLVKGIIDLHGGTVQARSGGVGRGSELIVELPLSGDAPRAARTETARSPARPLRVLVVEDNEDAAETLRMFLELEGHAVEVAGDGDDALSKSATFVPDVVLCDIGLPGKDGYEVARAIRHEGRAAEAVLVAVTGYAGPEDVRRAAEAGFDHHVPKPADMDVVRDILASAAG